MGELKKTLVTQASGQLFNVHEHICGKMGKILKLHPCMLMKNKSAFIKITFNLKEHKKADIIALTSKCFQAA